MPTLCEGAIQGAPFKTGFFLACAFENGVGISVCDYRTAIGYSMLEDEIEEWPNTKAGNGIGGVR